MKGVLGPAKAIVGWWSGSHAREARQLGGSEGMLPQKILELLTFWDGLWCTFMRQKRLPMFNQNNCNTVRTGGP